MIPLIIIIVSFILEGLCSLIFNSSLLATTFSFLSLLFIYPFVKENKNFMIISFIFGLIFVITYTGTVLLNAFIFLVASIIIIKLYKTFQMNPFNIIIISISLIIIYRSITYLFLLSISNQSFNIMVLLESIYSSLILNATYVFIIYFILTRKCFKKRIQNSKIKY